LSKSKTSSPEKNGSGAGEMYEKYLTHRRVSLKKSLQGLLSCYFNLPVFFTEGQML